MKMEVARVYEINLLLDPALSEKEVDKELESFKSLVSKFGETLNGDTKQKIDLAYPIKGKKIAWWTNFVLVSLTGDFYPKLLEQLRLKETVLRWIILKLSKEEQKPYGDLENIKQKVIASHLEQNLNIE
jgi:ribosomal protein S6